MFDHANALVFYLLHLSSCNLPHSICIFIVLIYADMYHILCITIHGLYVIVI